jgi:hypothetical protein
MRHLGLGELHFLSYQSTRFAGEFTEQFTQRFAIFCFRHTASSATAFLKRIAVCIFDTRTAALNVVVVFGDAHINHVDID